MNSLGERLAAARESRHLSQETVAGLLGVSRVMLSYWESNQRRPGEQTLERLASIYGLALGHLVSLQTPLPGSNVAPGADLVSLLYRDAETGIDDAARAGLRDFVQFLDSYADLAERLGTTPYRLEASPFNLRPGFVTKDDIRRKAEEVRSWLHLGMGPVGDLAGVLDEAGITVFRCPLGADLQLGVSGAYLHHPRVGMSIAVNVQTTPGRQVFTMAHELAHALYHSQGSAQVVSYWARKDDRERLADAWAGEFLVPQESLRRTCENLGIKSVTSAEEAVHLQRGYGVSYGTMLVRLLQAKLLDDAAYEALQTARPVALASALGYSVCEDEWGQDLSRWRLDRFPRRFVLMLATALRDGRVSPSTAASVTGLTLDEMAELMAPPAGDDDPARQREDLEFDDVRGRVA